MNKTMPVFRSPLATLSLQKGRNIPLSSDMVKSLPEGFTITGILPNRRQRRASVPHLNNRPLTNSRGVKTRKGLIQRFFDVVGNIIKTIIHPFS